MLHVGVVIGRYQPVLQDQLDEISHALCCVDQLVVVVENHGGARTIVDPWTCSERIELIRACLQPADVERVHFFPLRTDSCGQSIRAADLQRAVLEKSEIAAAEHVTFFHRDQVSRDPLGPSFPRWAIQSCPPRKFHSNSYVMMLYFKRDAAWRELVPEPVRERMLAFESTSAFDELREDYHHISEHRREWEGAPFPPTFVAVNAVILCGEKILVRRRTDRPGRSLIALPGRSVGELETLRDAIISELRDSIAVRIPPDELERGVVDHHVFDHPDRSLCGRTIAHAFCIDLGARVPPDVDCREAWWLPLHELSTRADEFFEDHAQISELMLSRRCAMLRG